jgi:hypothetical protein
MRLLSPRYSVVMGLDGMYFVERKAWWSFFWTKLPVQPFESVEEAVEYISMRRELYDR